MKTNFRIPHRLWDSVDEIEQQKILQRYVADAIIQSNMFDVKNEGETNCVFRVATRNKDSYFDGFPEIFWEIEVEMIKPYVQPQHPKSKESKMIGLKVLVLSWCGAMSDYIRGDDNSGNRERLLAEMRAWKAIEKFIEDEFLGKERD